MTDKITTDDILAALVNPLVWENDGGDSLYASVELGGEFTKYYSIDDFGEYDLWGAYFGVRCHEFGGVVIWKGTGKAAARAAAEAHHRAQVAAALNLDLIRRVVAALKEACDHYEYVHNEPAPWRIIATTFQAITEKVDGISCLLAEAKARVDAMSPEERAAMLARQRESYVRAEIGFGSDADEAEYRAALESGDPAEIDRVKRKEAARLEAYDKIKEGDK